MTIQEGGRMQECGRIQEYGKIHESGRIQEVGQSRSSSKVGAENHGAKGKCENPRSWIIKEVGESRSCRSAYWVFGLMLPW